MSHRRFAAALLGILAACSPASAPVATAPAPAPSPTSPRPTAAAPSPDSAAPDWHLLDATADGVAGISLRRAERELLNGRAPARTVVVAVIDGGIDTSHTDLRGSLWTNTKEVAGNGRDDDNNGYVDDVHGWNFIGGAGGDVNWETLEVTREYARCKARGAPASGDSLATYCARIASSYEAKRAELEGQSQQVKSVDAMLQRTTQVLQRALGGDSVTTKRVEALVPANDSVRNARTMFLRMTQAGIDAAAIHEAKEQIDGQLAYGYNLAFNPRTMVGDDPTNVTDRRYGNRNIMGPDAKHGSHVSGIVGAVRGNAGVDGVAGSVRVMTVRVVPNGDERDKDVANGIRYAVDNGAQIINMSFGKGFSPQKAAVDEAVRYAVSKGVLLVHAAGNDAEDIDAAPNFPTATLDDGSTAASWIEVGASSWRGGDHLAASFSNYGKKKVDVFAPGEDILSTIPGGSHERESGTSMAAPVVSGLTAFLMSHFPSLTAADVKRLILSTATSYADQMVARPGDPASKVRFGDLSKTGGIVNAWAAVKAAQALVRPIP